MTLSRLHERCSLSACLGQEEELEKKSKELKELVSQLQDTTNPKNCAVFTLAHVPRFSMGNEMSL